MNNALALEASGNLTAAAKELRDGIRLQPDDGEMRFALAIVYLKQQDWSAAESAFSRSIALGVPGDRVVARLLVTKLRQNKFSEVLGSDEIKEKPLEQLASNLLIAKGAAQVGIRNFDLATKRQTFIEIFRAT